MVAQLSALRIILTTIVVLSTAIFARLIHILPGFSVRSPPKERRTKPCHICIVLGSGGHTAEMLSLIQDLDPRRQSYRTYIVSTGDSFSSSKAVEFEANLAKRHGLKFRPANIDPGEKSESDEGSFEIVTVPRARKIHQPLWSTPLSSLSCLWACIKVLGKNGRCESVNGGSPDVILTNGPATGVIVVLAALILQFSGLKGQGELKTIYVESWARVKTLSLSGKILSLGLTDRFLVQWEGLKRGRAEYQGALLH